LPTKWVGALSRWIIRVEHAKKSPRRPLIIQGQADMTVDWQHNLQVMKWKFDRPQILLLAEARHHLANETVEMREEYFEFLSKRIRGRNL
jgi:alpha-beta hydrolase superfamily lysophospholipase